MLQLDPALLNRGLAATIHHGYGTFFPEPPELLILKKNWERIRGLLSKLDLDTYSGYDPMRSFAPKSRLNVRRVALLHPFDFVLYTSTVLALKKAISKHRLLNDRVFSYRPEGSDVKELYGSKFSFAAFRDAAAKKAANTPRDTSARRILQTFILGFTNIACTTLWRPRRHLPRNRT